MRNGFQRGALATVFFEPTGRFAFKLFKSASHPDHREQPPDEKTIRAIFASEFDAYKITSSIDALKQHTATFFGTGRVASVNDAQGHDVTLDYLPDCCIVMERLQGSDRKLATVKSQFVYLGKFTEALEEAGVRFTLDANVFSYENPELFKLIDFATNGDAMMSL